MKTKNTIYFLIITSFLIISQVQKGYAQSDKYCTQSELELIMKSALAKGINLDSLEGKKVSLQVKKSKDKTPPKINCTIPTSPSPLYKLSPQPIILSIGNIPQILNNTSQEPKQNNLDLQNTDPNLKNNPVNNRPQSEVIEASTHSLGSSLQIVNNCLGVKGSACKIIVNPYSLRGNPRKPSYGSENSAGGGPYPPNNFCIECFPSAIKLSFGVDF